MQKIVIDKPYQFVPPYRGRLWIPLVRRVLLWHLRRAYGITQIENHGWERLAESIRAGHAVLLTPNHCRDCDPLVLGPLTRLVGRPFYFMASWHLFMQSRLMTCLIRGAGAFSIYREGMDRAALSMASEILETAERPLVLFPEGGISGANDHLNPFLEGVALIARTAARKRRKASPAGKVVIHPVAIRYRFMGDIAATLEPVLDEIEQRLAWSPQRDLSLQERIEKIGRALLCLKEIQYLGDPQEGRFYDRIERLISHLLDPPEAEWLQGQREGTVRDRVKRLRTAILPDLVKGDIGESERQRRWHQLADVYLAQQLSCYPPDYLAASPTADRMLETVERFEEDLTDRVRPHPPRHAIIHVGEAIEVPAEREARGSSDPLLQTVEERLREMMGLTGELSRR